MRVKAGLLDQRAQAMKRVFDVVFASLLIVLTVPLAVAIAAAIVLESGSPVIFAHTRIGKDQRRFRLWKFRSMMLDGDAVLSAYLDRHPESRAEWATTYKLRNDPRVTQVGRFLRRFSLDELPQLWNVLRGDMSMVGPRPIVEREIPQYGAAFSLYSQVSPGLTGLWQVSGRNDTSYGERCEFDTAYIQKWTIWLDVRVLVKTVPAVILGNGAY